MSKSILILALCLMVAAVGLIATASAGCATCGAEENWNGLDKLNEIGNTSAQQQSPQVYTAKVARQTNSQFERQNKRQYSTLISNISKPIPIQQTREPQLRSTQSSEI